MNDDITIGPKKLFVFFNHVDSLGRTLYTGGDIQTYEADIEYIRADIAREREAKLIEAAYRDCGFDHRDSDAYIVAGIEELK